MAWIILTTHEKKREFRILCASLPPGGFAVWYILLYLVSGIYISRQEEENVTDGRHVHSILGTCQSPSPQKKKNMRRDSAGNLKRYYVQGVHLEPTEDSNGSARWLRQCIITRSVVEAALVCEINSAFTRTSLSYYNSKNMHVVKKLTYEAIRDRFLGPVKANFLNRGGSYKTINAAKPTGIRAAAMPPLYPRETC